MDENAIQDHVNTTALLMDSLDQKSATYRVRLRHCRDHFSEKGVHDLRTSIRRLQATAEIAGYVVSYAGTQKLFKDLDRQLDAFNELRDTQVMLKSIEEDRSLQGGTEPFEEYLKQRERDLSDAAEKRSKDLKPGPINRRLLEIREKLTSCSVLSDKEVQDKMLQAVDNAYRAGMQCYWEVDSQDADSIHQLRVEFKKFRYMIEDVQPLMPDLPASVLERLHDYQTRMGAIQDATVILQSLADFAGANGSYDPFPVRRYYERRLSQALSVYVKDKSALLNFWRATPLSEFPWETGSIKITKED
jgi:CHAD domain-containing protein